jgi:hypothetical protein
MNNDITTMIKALASGKASEANENFTRVMTSKINAVLDERKVSLASELYNKKTTSEVK